MWPEKRTEGKLNLLLPRWCLSGLKSPSDMYLWFCCNDFLLYPESFIYRDVLKLQLISHLQCWKKGLTFADVSGQHAQGWQGLDQHGQVVVESVLPDLPLTPTALNSTQVGHLQHQHLAGLPQHLLLDGLGPTQVAEHLWGLGLTSRMMFLISTWK